CAGQRVAQDSIHLPNYRCTAQESVPVNFDDFARAPRRFTGQCVRGFGTHNGLTLYGSFAPTTDADGRRAILIEIDVDTSSSGHFTELREYGEFTGLAYFCEDLDRYAVAEFEANKSAVNARARAMAAPGEVPEEISIITDGSCIYTRSGAVLIVSEWRSVPEPSVLSTKAKQD